MFKDRYELYKILYDLSININLSLNMSKSMYDNIQSVEDEEITQEKFDFEVTKRKYTCVAILDGNKEILYKIKELTEHNNYIKTEINNEINNKIDKLYNIFYIFKHNDENSQTLRKIISTIIMTSSHILTDKININFQKEFEHLNTYLKDKKIINALKGNLNLYEEPKKILFVDGLKEL